MPIVHGTVAPGFEDVRDEFHRNFIERGEIGAAVAAYWRGEKVVDLWGGRRTPRGYAPWEQDTMVIVFSRTKGISSMTLAVAVARGLLDYDERVATYWPEFAQNGKGEVTPRQFLGHEAGLSCSTRSSLSSAWPTSFPSQIRSPPNERQAATKTWQTWSNSRPWASHPRDETTIRAARIVVRSGYASVT